MTILTNPTFCGGCFAILFLWRLSFSLCFKLYLYLVTYICIICYFLNLKLPIIFDKSTCPSHLIVSRHYAPSIRCVQFRLSIAIATYRFRYNISESHVDITTNLTVMNVIAWINPYYFSIQLMRLYPIELYPIELIRICYITANFVSLTGTFC